MKLVFDMEGNGLREECTQMWCIVGKFLGEKGTHVITTHEMDSVFNHTTFLDRATCLIGHNIIGYDLPVFKKLYGWEPAKGVEIVDTLVLSRLLNPDREGGHSIEAWGKKLGRYKPEHEDWSQYSEEMLHRCTEDVEITAMVYRQLLQEMKE